MEPVKHLCIDDTLAHHWNIEPAEKGKPSKGICIKCDTVKRFNNSTWVDKDIGWRAVHSRQKEIHKQNQENQELQDIVKENT